MTSFEEEVLNLIRHHVDTFHKGQVASAAKALGIKNSSLDQWLKKKRSPSLQHVGPLLERIGARVVTRDTARDVVLVNLETIPAGAERGDILNGGNFMAVPIIEEVTRPNLNAFGDIGNWICFDKELECVRLRDSVVGVRVGQPSDFHPRLREGDIVFVDLKDRTPQPGKLMLVYRPDGTCLVRQVYEEKKGRDRHITLLHADTGAYRPETYSLDRDYGGRWETVIAGRVVLTMCAH